MDNILAAIAAKFVAFAAAIVPIAIDEGKQLLGKVAKDIEDSFLDLVEKVGEKATQLVTDLVADGSLSGLEKENLASHELVERAATSGMQLAAHDASTIIKNAYLAVKDKLASL